MPLVSSLLALLVLLVLPFLPLLGFCLFCFALFLSCLLCCCLLCLARASFFFFSFSLPAVSRVAFCLLVAALLVSQLDVL